MGTRIVARAAAALAVLSAVAHPVSTSARPEPSDLARDLRAASAVVVAEVRALHELGQTGARLPSTVRPRGEVVLAKL